MYNLHVSSKKLASESTKQLILLPEKKKIKGKYHCFMYLSSILPSDGGLKDI